MTSSVARLTDWLSGLKLHVKPTLKINGPIYTSAILAVDFGSPIEPVRLTSEQAHDLAYLIKAATTEITGRRSVRVNHDTNNGIYWTSI